MGERKSWSENDPVYSTYLSSSGVRSKYSTETSLAWGVPVLKKDLEYKIQFVK